MVDLFSSRIRSHFQKGFNPCIRGLGGVDLWEKNQKSKISYQSPFKYRYDVSTTLLLVPISSMINAAYVQPALQ
jgi:hypothetical protein